MAGATSSTTTPLKEVLPGLNISHEQTSVTLDRFVMGSPARHDGGVQL